MKSAVDSFIPLAPAMLHILASLAGGERHGYAIMQEVVRQSDGRYRLGPGTLYDNLQRLMKQGLVEEVEGTDGVAESRRRYYRLSGLGTGVLTAEIARLDHVVKETKVHLRSLPRRA